MEKYYKIAGLTVKMDSFGRSVFQAAPYETAPGDADIIIKTNPEMLANSRLTMSEENNEYMLTGGIFYTRLLEFDGMMLHASAVVVDGRAYLFTAYSGTGKSTHTQLWLEHFGSRAHILNDDKPALRLEDGVWYAYGTPWSGKHDISTPERVPLAGIAVLERAQVNAIEPYSGQRAVFDILGQTLRPRGPKRRERLLKLLDKLITQVPVWKLQCDISDEAVQVSYSAMSGTQTKTWEETK